MTSQKQGCVFETCLRDEMMVPNGNVFEHVLWCEVVVIICTATILVSILLFSAGITGLMSKHTIGSFSLLAHTSCYPSYSRESTLHLCRR